MTIIKHVVGLDHGNGWVKVRGENAFIRRPSYIGEASKVGTSYSNIEDLKLDKYVNSTDRKEVYVWGDDIKQVSGVLSTYSQTNRYTNPYYRLLCQFAIADALGEGTLFEDVLIITGVPSDEKGTHAEEDLKEALMGSFIINNKVIRVTEVVVLPQPLGTVMSLYLDEDGYVADDSFEKGMVGVIDVGTGTTDLDVIKDLRRLNDFKSIEFGVLDIYKYVGKKIKSKVGKLDLIKVEEGWEKGKYVESKRHMLPITAHKNKAIAEVFKYIEEGINEEWKDLRKFDKLIVTGGGVEFFEEEFNRFINDKFQTPKDPQAANAQGFYNYGRYVQAMKNGE